MARSKAQVQADLKTEYAQIDPSIDTEKGPVLDQFIKPQSQLTVDVEERQDRTDRLASADFTAAATQDELERMAGTVGAGSPQGEAATGTAFFGTRSRPRAGVTSPIPKGSLVSDEGLSYVYQTTEEGLIDGDYPDNYWNPTKRTYEVEIPIVAVAVGADYNLPPFRVRRILAPITGIDFVENRVRVSGGIDPGGEEATRARAESKLIGQELGSPGGLAAAVVESYEDAETVQVITSANYSLFRRATTKPGLDIYYSGEDLTTTTEEYTASGGEVTLTPTNKPLTAVTSVTVNGLVVAYELVEDDDPATQGSSSDASYFLFDTPLGVGAVVQMKYTYDSLCAAISEDYAGDDQGLFETSVVVRRSIRMNPKIVISGVADSGFNPFTLEESIMDEIKAFFETGDHGATYYPKDFRDHVGSEVIGLRGKPVVTLFQLDGRALVDIEPIELELNEIIEVDEDLITIDVQ